MRKRRWGRWPGEMGNKIKRCILHVGMHKTGSSSIQESLHGKLDSPDWRYLDLDHPNHSWVLSHAFIKGFLLPRDVAEGRLTSATKAQLCRDRLVRSLASCHAETVVISAEQLNMSEQDELAELRQLLSHWVEKVLVVAYVRAPLALTESRFQQTHRNRLLPIAHYEMRYRFRFEKFDRLFGRENVVLWKFDPPNFISGCVVRDFCTRLGIPLQSEWIVRSNKAMSREAVSLLYIYRRLRMPQANSGAIFDNERKMLIRLMSLSGEKLRFSRKLCRDLLERCAGDIAWMEFRLGESLQEERDTEGIQSLDELLHIKPETVRWLGEQLGRELPEGANNSEQLAVWVEELRDSLAIVSSNT